MGSGKSVVGALVAERTHSTFHDLDLMVEREAGMRIPEIFASGGEPAFREIERRVLPRALELDAAVAALGGGTLIDDANWRMVYERAFTVYIEVPFSVMWDRIRGMPGRPLASGRSRPEVEALLERRRPRYEQATRRVDGSRSVSVVADEVIGLWSG